MAGNEPNNKYAKLDQLSTEALRELLRAEIESTDEGDDDAIFHILEVIGEREKEHPTGEAADVDRSWKEFREHYATEEGKGKSLFSSEDPEHPPIKSRAPVSAARPRRWRIWRTVSVAAVVVCLIALFVPTALGYDNVFRMIAQWTEEQFQFVPSGEDAGPQSSGAFGQEDMDYDNLQNALDDYGITEAVAPKWIPDGFALTSVRVWESDEKDKVEFNAFYETGDKSISILFVRRETLTSSQYEKSDTPVNTYVAGGTEHYLFDNNGRTMAVWNIGNLECSMMGDIQTETMESIIDSIYER